MDRILRYREHDRKTLDIGCSTGYSTEVLSDTNDVIGIDISPTAVRAAKQRLKDMQFCVADIEHLPFRAGSFGQISCVNVIEYYPENIDSILRDFSKLLQPNGVCIISTATRNISRKDLIHSMKNYFKIGHVYPVTCVGTMAIAKYIPRFLQKFIHEMTLPFSPETIFAVYGTLCQKRHTRDIYEER